MKGVSQLRDMLANAIVAAFHCKVLVRLLGNGLGPSFSDGGEQGED